MKRYFCTYFDHNYLPYGMALFDSLVKSGIDFELFVLTLSDECHCRLENADRRIIPVRLQELEEYDPELAQCRFNRSQTEYIFTLSPCLPLFLFEKFPRIDLIWIPIYIFSILRKPFTMNSEINRFTSLNIVFPQHTDTGPS